MGELPLCHPRELITVAKPALCLDGDLSEDIPNNSPINCKKYLAKFGPALKRSLFGAETNPLTRSPLDNLEDGLLAWVILVVLLLVVEPCRYRFFWSRRMRRKTGSLHRSLSVQKLDQLQDEWRYCRSWSGSPNTRWRWTEKLSWSRASCCSRIRLHQVLPVHRKRPRYPWPMRSRTQIRQKDRNVQLGPKCPMLKIGRDLPFLWVFFLTFLFLFSFLE